MKEWCRNWPDGCRECGTTERKHHGQGYCTRCYRRVQVERELEPVRKTALRRTRAGQLQHFCFRCKTWKSETEFKGTSKSIRTRCRQCSLEVRRALYTASRKEMSARRREREARITAEMRIADRKRKTKKDSWYNRGVIPVGVVQSWLERAYELYASEREDLYHGWARVATYTGVNDRRLWGIRNGEIEKVTVDVAEKIAISIDAMDEFRELTRPGIPGWSKHSDYCLRCGRYDIPHRAMGYCRRCHQTIWWHRKRGKEPPFVAGERWAMWYTSCSICKTTEYAHRAHGICSQCYHREWQRKNRRK